MGDQSPEQKPPREAELLQHYNILFQALESRDEESIREKCAIFNRSFNQTIELEGDETTAVLLQEVDSDNIFGQEVFITRVIECIEDPFLDVQVQPGLLQLLWGIAKTASNGPKIVSRRGIEILLAIIKDNQRDISIQVIGLRLIYALGRDENDIINVRLSELGAIEIVMNAMTTFPDNLSIQRFGCAALNSLAGTSSSATDLRVRMTTLEPYRTKIDALGGLRAILLAMKTFPESARLQQNALCALHSVTFAQMDDERRLAKVGSLGGIEAVLLAIQNHAQDAELLRIACDMLANLAIVVSNRERIFQLKGIDILTAVMKNHVSNDDVLEAAIAGLGNIVVKTNLDSSDSSKIAAEAVLDAMISRESSPNVLEYCMTSLCNFMGKAFEPTEKCVDAVLSAMRKFPQHAEVQHCSLQFLPMAYYVRNSWPNMQDDVVRDVLSALSNHPLNALVQEFGCKCLANIIVFAYRKNSPALSKEIARSAAISISVAALKNFPSECNVIVEAIDLMHMILVFCFPQECPLTWDEIELLFNVMKSHPEHYEIQRSGSSALSSILTRAHPKAPQSRLAEDLQILRENRTFADVILITENRKIPCHKVILTRAEYFHSQLKERPDISEFSLNLPHEVLVKMLDHLYYQPLGDLSPDLASELHAACEKYGIADLKEHLRKKYNLAVPLADSASRWANIAFRSLKNNIEKALDNLFLVVELPQNASVIAGDMERLLNSTLLSDVTFEVEGKAFQAHKSILSARSPFFSACFSDTNVAKQSRISIGNLKTDVFFHVLTYIYTDDIERDVSSDEAVRVMLAANKFKLPRLRALIEESLKNSLHLDNAAWIFEAAIRAGAVQLKTCALLMILCHWDDVVTSAAFENLKPETAKLLREYKPVMK
eukprot:TRINITY_DN2879_c0_g1_i1.p1 TRINITY_DN2879_c0_g1~~TRINITY_DN2879_c0_g1_i1.p1  ORF type:complete len:900 (+),score=113.56 TRINITY_DN2879_c0_g1_i1:35-2701(+)